MKVEKTMGDQYREARLLAAQLDEHLATRAGAAEALDVTAPETVGRWERDEAIPSNLNVRRMAQAYRAPELLVNYCAEQCPIGKGRIKAVTQTSIERLTITLFNLSCDAQTNVIELLRMVEDGAICNDEKDDFMRIVEYLGNLKHNITTLELFAEKHGLQR